MRKVSIVTVALLITVLTSSAFSFDKHIDVRTELGIRKLLRLMDIDKNGVVSKNEFMRYMSQKFDELDVDHSRRLEPDELQAMNIPNWAVRKATKPKIKTR